MKKTNLLICAGTLALAVGCDSGSSDGGDSDAGTGSTTSATATDGGTAGTGGGTAGGTDTDTDTDTPIDSDNLIDNFDDGDGGIVPNGGRVGYWYTYNDETVDAVQTPPAASVLPEVGGPGSSTYSMHSTGSGFTVWGAGIGVDLNNEGDPTGMTNGIKMKYDASGFSGILLHVKGTGSIRVKVQTEATVPVAEGGTCAMECDPFGKTVPLTEEWTQHQLSFDAIFQEGWGTAATWDPATVMGLQFQVGMGTDFDFWIDEIGFYE